MIFGTLSNPTVLLLSLIAFLSGLLLAVRLMIYGAERRRIPTVDTLPLRRWELAAVGFLVGFGLTGYLLMRSGGAGAQTALLASAAGFASATIVTRLAIAAARLQPEHDPDNPVFILQGHIGVVTVAIPLGGEGMIRYEDIASAQTVRAREIEGRAIGEGQEICIDRVEDSLAYVELWSLVEARL